MSRHHNIGRVIVISQHTANRIHGIASMPEATEDFRTILQCALAYGNVAEYLNGLELYYRLLRHIKSFALVSAKTGSEPGTAFNIAARMIGLSLSKMTSAMNLTASEATVLCNEAIIHFADALATNVRYKPDPVPHPLLRDFTRPARAN
jgi:hypothetical protein